MLITYRTAPEISNQCRELIREYHGHLVDANIAYVFRSGRWIVKGSTQLGKAIVAPAVWRELTGYDLVLVVNEQAYMAQNGAGKIAMLDNLLCYFSPPTTTNDGCSYSTREPDIQEFSAIVSRRKVCFSNLPSIDGPGRLQKIEFEDNTDAADIPLEVIGEDEEDDDANEEPLFTVEDYDDIDDTGCTVTNLVSFKK